MNSYKTILPQITTFIFDVDGVLTDGSVLLSSGEVLRTMNSKDAYAIQYAAKLGYQFFGITGGYSIDVKNRLEQLGFREVYLSAKNKQIAYKELEQTYNLNPDEILYMGDDIPDLEMFSIAALSVCPKDAAVDVRMNAQYVSPFKGGKGCVRDVIEQTLRVQEKWMLPEAIEW